MQIKLIGLHTLKLNSVMNYILSISLSSLLCAMLVICLPIGDFGNILKIKRDQYQPITVYDDQHDRKYVLYKRLGPIPTFDDNGDYSYMMM